MAQGIQRNVSAALRNLEYRLGDIRHPACVDCRDGTERLGKLELIVADIESQTYSRLGQLLGQEIVRVWERPVRMPSLASWGPTPDRCR